MNSTGHNGEKAGYKVILLLVVGLTAFSSAMKELNQLQQFTLDASRFIAQLSDRFAPAEIHQLPQTTETLHTAIRVKTCEITQSHPSVELPWLSSVSQARARKPHAVVPRPSQVIDFKQDFPLPSESQIARLKKIPQIDIDPVQFEFRIAPGAEPDVLVISESPMNSVKTRVRKQREIRFNPRDREIFLKGLNRSINLRFAS